MGGYDDIQKDEVQNSAIAVFNSSFFYGWMFRKSIN